MTKFFNTVIYRSIIGSLAKYKLLRTYIFIFILIFTIYIFHSTNEVIKHMENQTQAMSRIFSRFIAISTSPDAEGLSMQIIYEEVIEKINFPVILLDKNGTPIAWKKIGYPEPTKILELSEEDKKILLREIKKEAKKMEAYHKPLEIIDNNSNILGYVYYRPNKEEIRLKRLPYITISGFILFIITLMIALRVIKRNQEKMLWIGLAKETAHQLGTPISALTGWITLLQEAHPDAEYICEEMYKDIDRLKKITDRFSKIGSRQEFEYEDIVLLIENIVDYFKSRLPRMNKGITISFHVENYVGLIPINKILIEWALENIIKNSIDAIQKKEGKIFIILENINNKQLKIKIKDDGKGMDQEGKSKIFLPGYTTKKRGWGLGMTLVKRIIEEYHNGRIYVAYSEPNKGTIMEILLPFKRSNLNENIENNINLNNIDE